MATGPKVLGWWYQTATIPGHRESRKIEAKKSRLPSGAQHCGYEPQGSQHHSPTALKLNSCAYSCLMCSRESVNCMVFSLQKYRPRANIKKNSTRTNWTRAHSYQIYAHIHSSSLVLAVKTTQISENIFLGAHQQDGDDVSSILVLSSPARLHLQFFVK